MIYVLRGEEGVGGEFRQKKALCWGWVSVESSVCDEEGKQKRVTRPPKLPLI